MRKGVVSLTLQDGVSSFLVEQQIRGNSEKTLIFYRSSLSKAMAFLGAGSPLDALTLAQLQGYYLALQKKGLSSVTIQSYIRAVRSFLTWCYREDYIPQDLSVKFRLPRAQRKEIDTLTDSEVQRLLACFNPRSLLQLRNLCICSLMLDSGLRREEVVTLSLPLLHVREGYAIVNGKGNKQRTVPLGLHTRKLLLRYLSRRPGCAPSDRVFLKANLSPVSGNTVRQMFDRLKIRADIPRLKAHLLRHTFATRYLENGGDMYSLQQMLGHTSLEMVKRYVHTTHRKTVSKFPDFSPLDNLFCSAPRGR